MSERRTCIGEPVSWLRLERYHAGTLEASTAASVESHLAACPACAECLHQIEVDDATPLPALDLAPARDAVRPPAKVVQLSSMRGRAVTVLGALAVAAAAMLGVGRSLQPGTVEAPSSPHVKGGDVAFALVRDDGVRIDGDTGVFRSGDRFKVSVTCPPALHASFDVTVFDDGGASFPLALVPALACGNDVVVPGAFRLTGSSDETVCLVWRDGSGSELRAAPRAKADLGPDALCKTLRPVAGP